MNAEDDGLLDCAADHEPKNSSGPGDGDISRRGARGFGRSHEPHAQITSQEKTQMTVDRRLARLGTQLLRGSWLGTRGLSPRSGGRKATRATRYYTPECVQ